MTMSCDNAGISGVQRFEVFTAAGKRRDWPPEVTLDGFPPCDTRRDEGISNSIREAASRFEARGKLFENIGLAERTAIDVGDKLELALRAEWGGRDLDEVGAELDEQTSRATDVESEIEAAILAEKAARDDLAAYSSQSAASHAGAARESAKAQMHLALERYLELSVARELMTSAMGTIRAEQQDSLIQWAGKLFAVHADGDLFAVENRGERSARELQALVAVKDGGIVSRLKPDFSKQPQ